VSSWDERSDQLGVRTSRFDQHDGVVEARLRIPLQQFAGRPEAGTPPRRRADDEDGHHREEQPTAAAHGGRSIDVIAEVGT
jgi:hypothetical protein